MRLFVFAGRNRKEIIRDPVNLAFGLGFPLILMFLFTAIQANMPAEAKMDLFEIDKITPGLAVFGLSFISLFSSMLIAKDRSSSFFMRMRATPLTASDFILGYALPFLPMSIAQSMICFITALFLGLKFSVNILMVLEVLIPTDILFIGIGLLAGSIFNDKQVGGICGALLTNLSAWLSGTWFDLSLVGKTFKNIAYALPFAHAVDAAKAAAAGAYKDIFPHIWWVAGYAIITVTFAVFAFNKKMRSDKI